MAIIFATQTSDGLPLNFPLVRGTRWEDSFQLVDQVTGTPVDLTGIIGLTMRARLTISSPILLELSTDNGRLIVTTAATGSVDIQVDSADTLLFPENSHRKAKYVYDVVIERAVGEFEPAIGGKIIVIPQVTRPWGTT
ncbi:MAG TPA: hypothetical protein VIQ76_16020 [Propionibacteriaceae bacterium]|jgi:hypothetical protein